MKNEVAYAALAGLRHELDAFARHGGAKEGAAARLMALAGVPDDSSPAQLAWVRLAHNLAAGAPPDGKAPKQAQLRSIFGSGLKGYDCKQYMPLARLNPTSAAALFPQAKQLDAPALTKAYAELWQGFEAACQQRLPAVKGSPERIVEALYNLLLEYAWCVPSPAATRGDVSLYDQARTSAALAACFAADDRAEAWCQAAPKSSEPLCLLVGGDLSGLQKFIYNITSGGAAKSLRARSFYIQLLEDALSSALMRTLELPGVNLLYVGGGGFQALVPMQAAAELKTLVEQWNEKMLTLFQGGLGVTLCWEALTHADFADFGAARDRLGQKIQIAKRRPFAQASPQALFKAVGSAFNSGGDPLKFCAVTGEDGDNLEPDEDGVYKSRFVRSLEELGRRLPTAAVLMTQAVPETTPTATASDWRESLHAFGYDVAVKLKSETFTAPANARVWRLHPDGAAVPGAVTGYRPFAQLTPIDPKTGLPLTFDDLAKPLAGHGKFERWGVLRMDVDNLGNLFREGFAGSATLARSVGLSLQLRLFFEGWLPQLADKQGADSWQADDLRQNLYIQYAGGDDVFVVGSWDALPLYARRIRESFKTFTCGNKALSISGGIIMADAGFPIDQAALLAGEAEDQAKQYTLPGKPEDEKKNAITFMDLALSWDLFAEAQADAERMASGIQDGKLPRALVQTVLSLYGQMQSAQHEAQRVVLRNRLANPTAKPGKPDAPARPVVGRWTWMSAYQFTRLADSIRKDEDAKTYVLLLREKLMKPDAQVHALGLAARWAQYLIRGAKAL